MTPSAVIVDDSNAIRSRLRAELSKLGIRVVAEGASGDKIVPLYEEHRPSLMMLDIILPEVDGVTAATELLKKYPDAKVVMCSSLTARDKILACRAAGVKHFLLKPFSSEKVAEMVRQVLGLAPAAAPLAVAS